MVVSQERSALAVKSCLMYQLKFVKYLLLFQSAQRALDKYCGAGVNAFFTSNAPSGFYKYKFPKGAREEYIGAKLFIYNAYLPRESQTHATYTFNASKVDQVLDHAWLARDELRSFMKPKYIAAVDKTILKWS